MQLMRLLALALCGWIYLSSGCTHCCQGSSKIYIRSGCALLPLGLESVQSFSPLVLPWGARASHMLYSSGYKKEDEFYSAAIDLNFTTSTNCHKVRSGKMLWDKALLDVKKVVELNPSSYFGYHLKHAVLHGAHRYHEAIKVFRIRLPQGSSWLKHGSGWLCYCCVQTMLSVMHMVKLGGQNELHYVISYDHILHIIA
ncbi:hypothetical protein BD769DRAFT_1383687 [Suillus cothurnatus]|nr:hypothetical protein BD769DRAFT_1383687 [Suillus cothurnatus]